MTLENEGFGGSENPENGEAPVQRRGQKRAESSPLTGSRINEGAMLDPNHPSTMFVIEAIEQAWAKLREPVGGAEL